MLNEVYNRCSPGGTEAWHTEGVVRAPEHIEGGREGPTRCKERAAGTQASGNN